MSVIQTKDQFYIVIRLMITSLLSDNKPADLHIFRNYTPPSELALQESTCFEGFIPLPPPEEQCVWKAARASGAAPSYFRFVITIEDLCKQSVSGELKVQLYFLFFGSHSLISIVNISLLIVRRRKVDHNSMMFVNFLQAIRSILRWWSYCE